MAIDRRLLDILCCPTSKVPLKVLSREELAALNQEIGRGVVTYVDGERVEGTADAALLTSDRRSIYLIDSEIPVLLPERAIAVGGLSGFPG
jgi:uncharacterized protein